MPDLDQRFRALDRVRPPDLWADIRRKEPRPIHEPPPGRRFLAAVVAFAVASAGIALGVRAFRGAESVPAATVENGKIAFVVSRDGEYEIFLMDENGAPFVRLSGGRDPAWSPDGTRVAFTANEDRLGISIVNADGTGSVKLTDKPAYAQTPTWSPDGEQIAYAAADGIYVMDSDGTDVHRITGYTGPLACDDFDPSWSPDGARIAFAVRCDGGGLGIFTVDADGSDRAMVTGRVSLEGESAESLDLYGEPAWAPDGARIAFTGGNVNQIPTQHIYTINADGTGIDRITDGDVSDWSPIWSPDGAEIAFISRRSEGRGIYVMDPGGLNVRRLTSDPTTVGTIVSCCLSWQPVPLEDGPTPTESPPVADPRVVASIPVGDFPNAVAFGEGSVWVSVPNNDGFFGGEILRIDPATHEIVARIPVDAIPIWETGGGGLAVGAGSVWVAAAVDAAGGSNSPGGGLDGVLIRIDPATNEAAATTPLGGVEGADVAVADSGVWVLIFDTWETMSVLRLDPSTDQVVATIPVPGIWGQEIFATEDGVFVNTRDPFPGEDSTVGASRLTMIDPATNEVRWSLSDTRFVESFQSDRTIWAQGGGTKYANVGGENLVRLDSQTGQVVGQPIQVDDQGRAFAVDPDGGVWLQGGDDEGWTIDRFDPVTQTTDASIEIGEYTHDNRWWPVAVDLDHETDTIWIVHYRDNVTRIDLG